MAGVLLVDADAPSFDGAIGCVTVEDARRADGPAVTLASVKLADLSHRQGVAARIPFALDCPDLPERGHWSVRASLDAATGRLFSTTRVNLHAAGEPVLVRVEPVDGGGQA